MSDQHPSMTRSEVIKQLHAVIDDRLFGPAPWAFDAQIAEALRRSFERMGLEEQVPGPTGTSASTTLGRELQVDLMMVFVGLWDPPDVPWILLQHGLLDEPAADLLFDRLCAPENDPRAILLPVVREAYCQYFRSTRLLN